MKRPLKWYQIICLQGFGKSLFTRHLRVNFENVEWEFQFQSTRCRVNQVSLQQAISPVLFITQAPFPNTNTSIDLSYTKRTALISSFRFLALFCKTSAVFERIDRNAIEAYDLLNQSHFSRFCQTQHQSWKTKPRFGKITSMRFFWYITCIWY